MELGILAVIFIFRTKGMNFRRTHQKFARNPPCFRGERGQNGLGLGSFMFIVVRFWMRSWCA
ncbi:MAG TPA: hypothetical protein VFE46_12090 [Pirellulales bacterium]|jgi:hypothetical protein|nr:hypothetical protein [Pirellulales bacterium]